MSVEGSPRVRLSPVSAFLARVQVGTSCITGRQWKRVLLSSESDKIPKVVLLRQTFDQARAPHEQKADALVKSKLKRTAVRSSGSLAASTWNVRFSIAGAASI